MAIYIRGCPTYFKYAQLRVFYCSRWSWLVGNGHSGCIPPADSQANVHLFYLKSAQPEIFSSLRGNRLIIKPKTLSSHPFYVSTKLASEKGGHTHVPVFLGKPEGPSHRKAHAPSAMHSFMMWREMQGGRPSSQRNPCSPGLQVLPLVSARKSLTSGMNMAHICSTAEVTVALWTAAGWGGGLALLQSPTFRERSQIKSVTMHLTTHPAWRRTFRKIISFPYWGVCHGVCGAIRGQGVIIISLLLCGSRGSNSGPQVQQQVPLPTVLPA